MLISFRIHNFRCVKDLCLDLQYAEGKAPNGYKTSLTYPFFEKVGKRVVPVLALYGANASGKTTILGALASFRTLITSGWNLGLFMPNRLVKDAEEEIRFSLSFLEQDQDFELTASLNREGICSEKLKAGNEVLYSIKSAQWLEGDQRIKHVFDSETFRSRAFVAETKRQVRSFLMIATNEFPGLDSRLNLAYGGLTKVEFFSHQIQPPYGLKRLCETFEGSEQIQLQQALNLISEYLHKLDFRVQRLSCQKEKMDISKVPEPLRPFIGASALSEMWRFQTYHQSESGSEVSFNLMEESQGTQNLVGMLGIILSAIRTGRTILVDELDSSLHPLLVCELVKLFKYKELNPLKAQILFTLHNTDLLASSLLSVSEVGIISQEGFNGTQIRRIVEFEGCRNVDNFRKRYLQGFYRGIPYPYI